jgi:hypothetical protein
MGKVTLSLIVLKTRQLDRLRKFYASLGINLVEEKHGKGPVHYAARIGDTVMEVYPLSEKDSQPDATIRLGFTVEKVEEVMEALKLTGICIVLSRKSQNGDIARW